MQTNHYESIKVIDQHHKKIIDCLVIEAPLQININGEAYTVVMRTPNDDLELIRGLLYAEDIYKRNEEIVFEITEKKEDFSTIINACIPPDKIGKGYLNKRTLLSVSSCGICGKKELKDLAVSGDKIKTAIRFYPNEIKQMYEKMNKLQKTFHSSGGSHAASLFNKKQELLTIKEDIGRHNAVDKTIGDLLLKNQLKQASYLLVSGRVSYEIISKAFIAKIPVIVAVSACSSLAVDFAKEFGICLIGFSRENKMTIYSHPTLLKSDKIEA